MIRRLVLAGLLSSLAGCSPGDAELLQALGQDHNPVCVDITLATPWGTEHVQINRLNGCGSPVVPAVAPTAPPAAAS